MPNLLPAVVRRLALTLCVATLPAVAVAATSAAAPPAYQYRPLLPLGGPQGNGVGWAINQHGEVAGGSLVPGEFSYVPTRWTASGTPVGLGFLSDMPLPAVAYGINDRGQSVGADVFDRPILWNGTQPTLLQSLHGLSSQAAAINNAGQIVGWSMSPDTFGFHATLWENGQPLQLRSLGGPNSFATDINESGMVAGAAEGTTTPLQATVWRNGEVQTLGSWHGYGSFAQGVNDLGHVVGGDSDAQGASHAFLWNGSAMSLLAPLEGNGAGSYASDLNNLGQVVGYSNGQGDQRATLWHDGVAVDLNSFLDAASVQAGWRLLEANAINDDGWITGVALNGASGQRSAFLLAPVPAVPEPAALVLALVGLLTLGAAAIKPRQRS